jgi:purine-binding chemotaxis protein CheW
MEAARQREYRNVLVFEVEGESYGVDADRVQEIVRAVLPSRLPSAPSVIGGVFNVRGKVVALIDLRARFGLAPRPLSPDEVFILLRSGQADARALAFRADRARELMRIASDSVVPIAYTTARASYAAGTAVLPDGLLLLCDVERFLSEAEELTLSRALSAAPEQSQ